MEKCKVDKPRSKVVMSISHLLVAVKGTLSDHMNNKIII